MFKDILIAYNDLEIRNILYEAFSNLGYKASTVATHKDILETLKRERPHFIVLDNSISDIPAQRTQEMIKAIDENIKVIIPAPPENTAQAIIENILKILREEEQISFPGQKKNQGIQFRANVLVVDDESECAGIVKDYLLRKGCDVSIASSGEEAMLKIETIKPNIVLLDIRMAGIDGLIILKKIKDMDKNIIVIITSAINDEKNINDAIKLGADGYLIKPFNLKNLKEIILKNVL